MAAGKAQIRVIKRAERMAAQAAVTARSKRTGVQAVSAKDPKAGVSAWVHEFRQRRSTAASPQYAFALLFK